MFFVRVRCFICGSCEIISFRMRTRVGAATRTLNRIGKNAYFIIYSINYFRGGRMCIWCVRCAMSRPNGRWSRSHTITRSSLSFHPFLLFSVRIFPPHRWCFYLWSEVHFAFIYLFTFVAVIFGRVYLFVCACVCILALCVEASLCRTHILRASWKMFEKYHEITPYEKLPSHS